MRISTSQIFNGGTSGILDVQSSVYKLTNQMSAGTKILTPEDDPVAAAKVVVVTQSQNVNKLYSSNQGTASTTLATLDSTLSNIYDELNSIYSAATGAGNGAYSDSQRADIATELSERLDNLVNLANSRDGNGRYIFGGTKSTTQPFTLNASADSSVDYNVSTNSYVTYNGNDAQQTLQVGSSQFVTLNESGSGLFMQVKDSSGTATGASVFDAVQNMIEYLNTPGADPSSTEYTTALSNISAAMDTIAVRQASVGARESALEGMTNVASERDSNYTEELSNLQHLDYTKAASDLAQKKLQLEAAQSAFSATAKLSLFSYI